MPKTETSSNALDYIDLEKVSGGTDVVQQITSLFDHLISPCK